MFSPQCLPPQVAIMTPDMASFQTVEEAGYSQEQDDLHPVTLLATSNGTHIAVQVGTRTCFVVNTDLISKTKNSLFVFKHPNMSWP